MLKIFELIGRYFMLMGKVFSRPEKAAIYRRRIIFEMESLGVNSIGLTAIISVFIGAVITLQMCINLDSPFIPRSLVGYATRETMILEFSSAVVALILAGKVGSSIASEIGTMRITEQIDALEIMGVNSASYLILPKIVAAMVFFPFLTILSILIGILGGYLIAAATGIMIPADYVDGLLMDFKPYEVSTNVTAAPAIDIDKIAEDVTGSPVNATVSKKDGKTIIPGKSGVQFDVEKAKEIIGDGFDILVCRELTGDVYFGKHYRRESDKGWGETGADDMNYSVYEVERIGRRAFEMAMKRNKKVCSVDKANVLETSRVWRETMHHIKDEYPEVEYTDMYVDNCAMQLVRNPGQFDVIVTGNLFGDILSDEASMITGSIGMIPSSSLGDGTRGLYEPIHGSAPDIAGKDIVNPTACILSAAMMLRYSFGMTEEADAIENAVNKVLDKGLRTADNMSEGCTCLGCTAMGDAILAEI